MNKVLAVLILTSFLPASQAFADRAGISRADVKLLNESSAALTGIDSGLARKVQRYASKETGETKATPSEKKKAREEATTDKDDLEMLRQAARKLKSARPDLSKRLDGYAAKKAREPKNERESRRK